MKELNIASEDVFATAQEIGNNKKTVQWAQQRNVSVFINFIYDVLRKKSDPPRTVCLQTIGGHLCYVQMLKPEYW